MENENISLASEIISDLKKGKTHLMTFTIIMCIIWFITFATLVGVTCYTIYLLNDIAVVESTDITQETEDGDNNYIGNDGDIVNGETESKNS